MTKESSFFVYRKPGKLSLFGRKIKCAFRALDELPVVAKI